MNLHMFSSPGKDDIRYILAASRPYLEGKEDPVVAYLPAASFGDTYQGYTERAFDGLAHVQTINPELMTTVEIEAVIRDAAILYIPGGNTFLLNHRLQLSNIKDYLRKKVTAGLPLITFSAGTVLCGPNILTSSDINTVETPYFSGLNVSTFNFSCHYPEEENSRTRKDNWLVDYHIFHDNPIIMLADGAHLQVEGKRTSLVRGEAWILRKGQEKQRLEPGSQFTATQGGFPASVPRGHLQSGEKKG